MTVSARLGVQSVPAVYHGCLTHVGTVYHVRLSHAWLLVHTKYYTYDVLGVHVRIYVRTICGISYFEFCYEYYC